jgi:hypothetical protein
LVRNPVATAQKKCTKLMSSVFWWDGRCDSRRAVADYKLKLSQKNKKTDDTLVIELEKTKDILASLGR